MSNRNESRYVTEITVLAKPADANTVGTIFGGRIMELMDMAAAICARRYSNLRVQTVCVEKMEFSQPLKVGHVICVKATINRTFNTSMEVGISVYGEDTYKQNTFLAATAFFIIAGLDEVLKPTKVEEYIPKTTIEKERWEEAGKRRTLRMLDE